MPAAVARRRLPDAIYLTPDFPAYREASAQVMEVLRRNVETVEVVGLDEAYLDLTGIFSPKSTMRRIAAEIREDTGLTCSVGISESRMLAKITSELGKPAGLVVLSREDALERFAGESPGLVPGIGPKTVLKLRGDGDPHPRRSAPPGRHRAGSRLRTALGRLAARPRPALGRDADHRLPRDQIAVGGDDLRRRRAPARRAGGAPGRAGRGALPAAGKRELEGRTIGIKVRLDDWTNVSRSHTVEEPTNDPAVVGPVALDLLRAYDPQRPVRLLGVRVASFENDADAARPSRPPEPAQAPAAARPLLVVGQDGADAREAEPVPGRLGQVVVAPGDVGAAVDHRHGDRAAVVAAASPSSRRAASCWRRPASPASGCRRRRRRCRRGRGRSRRRRPGGSWSGAGPCWPPCVWRSWTPKARTE